MAFCVSGFAIETIKASSKLPKPMLYTGPVEKVEPLYYQEVMTPDHGKTIIPLGPQRPYHSTLQKRINGTMQYDAFETPAGGGAPGEGVYNSAMLPTQPGARWYYGDGLDYPNAITHMNKLRTAGVAADGIDVEWYVGTSSTMSQIALFTYNDAYSEVSDPTAPVPPSAIPSSGNTGVVFTFASITGPSVLYANLDVSSLNSGAGFAMPTGNDGWYQCVIANTYSPLVYPTTAYCMFWGTQGTNPGFGGHFAYGDGNGSSGSQGTTYLWSWGYQTFAMPTTGTVTRGTTIGSAVNVANLRGVAGSSVQVTQALQSLLSRNNAEITVTCQLDPSAAASTAVNELRPILVGKANSSPLATSTMVVSMQNQTTTSYDAVYSAPAKNSNVTGGTDGDWIWTVSPSKAGYTSPNAPYSSLSTPDQYIGTDANGNRFVNVRVGVKQLLPSLLGWKLTVNQLQVNVNAYGPGNFNPTVGFSTNRG